jgi:hypothetical protein
MDEKPIVNFKSASPTSIVDYKSASPVKAHNIIEEEPLTKLQETDFILTIASLITLCISLFIFHKILNVAYDYRKLIPGSQLAQTLHNYTVLLNYFRKIISNSESIYAENLLILLDTIYYVIFVIIPDKIGLPDEFKEYIIKSPKVFAGRPHIQAFLKSIIDYLEKNGFNEDIVTIMNQSLELASEFFRITYGFTLDSGATTNLAKITIQAVTEFDSENSMLLLSPSPNKLSLGLNIFTKCLEKITNVNSALRGTVDFEERSEEIGKVIGNTIDYIGANVQVLYRRNIEGDTKKSLEQMLQSETSKIVFFEGGFIEKVVILEDSIKELLKKYMPLLKRQLPPAEEIGGRRRKSRKNKGNKRSKKSKKRFKSRKIYYKPKGSLLYKLFL